MRILFILVVTWFLAIGPNEGADVGQTDRDVEYKLKAACLYNFARFVEWPSKAFGAESDPLVIAVVGPNPFGSLLDEIVKGRTINNRPVAVRYVSSPRQLNGAHVAFVARDAKTRDAQAISDLTSQHVLTVGEDSGFLKDGGSIQFVVVEKKIRFAIAEEAAGKAGLKIGAQLMSLALPAKGAN
jgi:hypothetical protein